MFWEFLHSNRVIDSTNSIQIPVGTEAQKDAVELLLLVRLDLILLILLLKDLVLVVRILAELRM